MAILRRVPTAVVAASILWLSVELAPGAEEAPRRAAPTAFSKNVRDAFVDDFRSLLDDPRPSVAGSSLSAGPRLERDDERFQWSRLIDAESLTTEIKRIANGLAVAVASPSAFNAGGRRAGRRDFALLAVLFAVVAEHDGEIRFRDEARQLRDAMARASVACESAGEEAYALARSSKADLDDLLRGQPPPQANAAANAHWNELASRALLMQRMESGLEGPIADALVDKPAVRRRSDDLGHEAQMLALMAEIITRQQYEFWDDETYLHYAKQLQDASLETSHAAEEADLERLRASVAKVRRACSDCHDGYR